MRAVSALENARQKDHRPMGQLLGDAIRNSVNTLLLIGGFIILFSVIIRIMTVAGIVGIFSSVVTWLLVPFGMNPALTSAIISGMFEVMLGSQLAGQAPAAVPIQKVMVASAIIAWSDLSVHAQVASIISGTDMKIAPFVVARFVHAIQAAFFVWLLMEPLAPLMALGTPVFANLQPFAAMTFWQKTIQLSWLFVYLTIGLILLGLSLGALRKIKIIFWR
ncbi:MAG: Sporulation integral membrane protein YlbJ [Syntrophomonadaceae bacterium]|nr:Sporulation integral membrane protein YlbJ [Bacillota bacterium]